MGHCSLPGKERFIQHYVWGQQALRRGGPTSRLLGGTGRHWEEAGQGEGVFPGQNAGSRRDPSQVPGQQTAPGMQVRQQGAGSSGPHHHHLMRVKMEVPTLQGNHVSRRGRRDAG